MSTELREGSIRGVLLYICTKGSSPSTHVPAHHRAALEWLYKRYFHRPGQRPQDSLPDGIWRCMYRRHPDAMRNSWSPVFRQIAAQCDAAAAIAAINSTLILRS